MSKSAIVKLQRVEEATIRMLMPEKVARSTEMAIIEAVAKYAWNDGPMPGQHDIESSILHLAATLMASIH